MGLIQEVKSNLLERKPGTPASSVLDRSLLFDEFQILDYAIPHIKRSSGIAEIKVVKLSVVDGAFQGVIKGGEKVDILVMVDKAVPGQPVLAFENI